MSKKMYTNANTENRVYEILPYSLPQLHTGKKWYVDFYCFDPVVGQLKRKKYFFRLSNDEKAFYDALTRPQAVKDFYSNDQLVALTKDLTNTLRKNRTIDWNRRESERANMRRLVKRLLKLYKYPPEDTMNIVLKQCEQWAENQDL